MVKMVNEKPMPVSSIQTKVITKQKNTIKLLRTDNKRGGAEAFNYQTLSVKDQPQENNERRDISVGRLQIIEKLKEKLPKIPRKERINK